MSKLNVTKTMLSMAVISLFLVACDGSVKIDENGVDVQVDTEKPNIDIDVNEKKENVKTESTDIIETKSTDTPPPTHIGKTEIGHYTAYSNGTAVDNETGMMWARCSVGQEWDSENLTCTGEVEKYTWEDAFKAIEKLNQQNYLGYSDWQLPHIEDLSNLRYCSTGFKSTTFIPTKNNADKEVGNKCNGTRDEEQQIPTINKTVFPNTKDFFYWSATPNEVNKGLVYIVYLYNGQAYGYARKDKFLYTHAVRENN